MQVAEPLLARGVPVSLAPASVPAHAIRVGRTGAPAAVTRTAATRADPAFGRRGVSFTVLAVTDVEVPPPSNRPPTWVPRAPSRQRSYSRGCHLGPTCS